MNNKISHNYFTGDQTVPLSSTLEEVEVLFAANENVKSMANSGALKELHDRHASLHEQSESQYINLRDKIENILQTVESKEEEICAGIEALPKNQLFFSL